MRRNVSSFSFQQPTPSLSLSVEDDDGGREAAEGSSGGGGEVVGGSAAAVDLVRHVCVGHGGYSTVWVVADAA